MIGHGEKLSRKMEMAVLALLSEPTIELAARQAGISSATLWRWLQLSEFRKAYLDARRQVVEAALGRLQQATDDAVLTLRLNLDCGMPSVEVQAARAILDHAEKALELMDLSERVAKLERYLLGEGIGDGTSG